MDRIEITVTVLDEMTDDPCELHAHYLRAELKMRGVASDVHRDRSPWGVRIPLTDDDHRRLEYGQPSLFVLTEGGQVVDGQESWRWFGGLGGFGDELDSWFDDTHLEWYERSWAGETVETVADALVPLVGLLRAGVREMEA